MNSIRKYSSPLVSIVLATYNGEKFLEQQLDSLIKQDYPNIEIIAIDDCSSDKTFQILQQYAIQYAFFKAYINEKNLGLNKNFERGLLLAQGEYIAIADQDDIWKKKKVSTLINRIGNNTMVYHDSELIDSNGASFNKKLSDVKKLSDFSNPLNYALVAHVPGHAMLFKKSLVAQCIPFPKKAILYDHWLAYVATFDQGIRFINQALVLYRQHENNMHGAGLVEKKLQNPQTQALKKTELARERVRLLYEKCPETGGETKKVFGLLFMSYKSFSLCNNFRRMILFFKYNREMLIYKNYSQIRKWLFCLKTFCKMP